MILKELVLSNFRNLAKLKLKFKTGVTGIIGINGTGKSSIIEAIQFALTGNLFNGASRAEALRAGTDSGFCVLHFEINGKKGSIERHLDVSKVLLNYDGITYKKASEVKELLDTLLQVNPEIIEKVIIGQQGDIPLLFAGDRSIREKIFQKIFLVPNTEKLRRVIFDKYIKTAPPVYVVKDRLQLQTELDNLIISIEKLQIEISQTQKIILSAEEEIKLKEELAFLKRCKINIASLGVLTKRVESLSLEKDKVQDALADITQKLTTLDIDDCKTEIVKLEQQKKLFKEKTRIQQALNNLPKVKLSTSFEELQNQIKELAPQIVELTAVWGEARGKLAATNIQLQDYRELKGKAVCATCGQSLKSVASYIASLEAKKQQEEASVKSAYIGLGALQAKEKELEYEVQQYIQNIAAKEKLETLLEPLRDIEFNEEDIQLLREAVESYNIDLTIKKDLTDQLTQLQKELALTEQRLSTLETYTGDNLDSAIAVLETRLTYNTECVFRLNTLNFELNTKFVGMKEKEAQIVDNEENVAKNLKREKYLMTLNRVYDAFHSSNFPQKLIMQYSSTLTEYLQENLEGFNLPYKVKIDDQFNFILTNKDGQRIPKASGGQQMQIGISLHFALHSLFSQSFPLMILDEGTTHLDKDNRDVYFEMLKKVKQKKMKQVIIIDHDSKLMDVVDNVIQLQKQ